MGVNMAINEIRYFTSDPSDGFAKRSLRIGTRVRLYVNAQMCSDESYFKRSRENSYSICGKRFPTIDKEIYILPLTDYNIDTRFNSNKEEIYKLLADKGIKCKKLY